MAECSVMVGVRIRPFNKREVDLNAQVCVEMVGPTTILKDLEDGKKEPKKFTFDQSFWSHDGFVEDEHGFMSPAPGSNYADQKYVFETFGKQVLDNAWEGYHCCLFAYGQTGSGKSYSMVGYGANKGIVPLACEEIFRRIDSQRGPDVHFEATASMIEIYNEAVQDLLMAPKDRPKKGLDIRQNQLQGVYIDGVKKRPVNTYAAIEKVVADGTANRTVGATLMNATSSRAHTVITIELKQVRKENGQENVKTSTINLVDLAGSEKAGQTGATGDRLKEGSAINKSLSALGNVIEKLADKASGKAKPGAVIPYRDSKLTRLLQDALGGSSKTIMICAISPASSNYEETLSTLRYADRAKRIKNVAVVNENPQERLIRQLKEENEKLKSALAGKPEESGPDLSDEVSRGQENIAALEQALVEMETSFARRLQEEQERIEAEQATKANETPIVTEPHITNLNEDLLLTNKLQFAFGPGETHIGRASPNPAGDGSAPVAQVELAGPGIHQEQAVVVNSNGQCVLTAVGQAASTTFVNGQSPASGTGITLNHGDRVVFGSCIFIFVDPQHGSAEQLLESKQVSYALARSELGGKGGLTEEELAANKKKAEELERQVREAEEAKALAQREAEALIEQREKEYQAQIQKMHEDWAAEKDRKAQAEEQAAETTRAHAEELARVQREFEERKRQNEEEAQRRIEALEMQVKKATEQEEEERKRQINLQKLDELLQHMMPLVKEANLIAEELKQPRRIETKILVDVQGKLSRGEFSVMAAVVEGGIQLYEWTPDTLENRVFLMRELLQRFDEEGPHVVSNLSQEDDPWWDPVQERRIGIAQVILEGLAEQVENVLDARILNSEGQNIGALHVEIWPLSKDGHEGIPDEEFVEELLGTKMTILVRVSRATGLPKEVANDVRVEFKYFLDDSVHSIPAVAGHNCNPEFNFEQRFVQDPVTSRFLDYIKTESLVFNVFGRSEAAEQLQSKRLEDNAAAQAEAMAKAATSSIPSPEPPEPVVPQPEPVAYEQSPVPVAYEPSPVPEMDVGAGAGAAAAAPVAPVAAPVASSSPLPNTVEQPEEVYTAPAADVGRGPEPAVEYTTPLPNVVETPQQAPAAPAPAEFTKPPMSAAQAAPQAAPQAPAAAAAASEPLKADMHQPLVPASPPKKAHPEVVQAKSNCCSLQ